MSVTKVTNDNIVDVSAETVSGTLPALNASAVLNMPTGENVIESADFPAVDSNMELGQIWLNTTSGEIFVCTDASTNENVWKNIAAGADHVTPPWAFQGTVAGYAAGGSNYVAAIEKVAYASDGDAVESGSTLEYAYQGSAGSKSKTHGYVMNGYNPSGTNAKVQKYSFTTAGQSSDIGNLTVSKYCPGGGSSELKGYSIAGLDWKTDISYQSHTVDGDHGQLGTLFSGEQGYCGAMSGPTEILAEIGWNSTNSVNIIVLASDSTSTDHCDMTGARYGQICASSITHGYSMKAHSHRSEVRKTGFAAGSIQVHVSGLSLHDTMYQSGAGHCSETHAYAHGGYTSNSNPHPGHLKHIQKFAFATDSDLVDVGNVTAAKVSDGWIASAQI